MNGEVMARLREEAKRLLADGEVLMVVGYREGTSAAEAIPAFLTDPEGVDSLIFNPLCIQNPATFLKRASRDRVAVIAKPCDTRSLVALIQEKQLSREQLVVMSVPCPGIVDMVKFGEALGDDLAIVESVSLEGEVLSVSLAGKGTRELKLTEVHALKCAGCTLREPVIADIRLDEGVTVSRPELADLLKGRAEEMERKAREERLCSWREFFSRCIRCYACRNVCPVCFCEKCFADETRPQWVARSLDHGENELFHLVRFMHVAGRCTECGECERACPMGIPLTVVTEKMNREVEGLFGHIPGQSLEEIPPLGRFALEDLDIFGKG